MNNLLLCAFLVPLSELDKKSSSYLVDESQENSRISFRGGSCSKPKKQDQPVIVVNSSIAQHEKQAFEGTIEELQFKNQLLQKKLIMLESSYEYLQREANNLELKMLAQNGVILQSREQPDAQTASDGRTSPSSEAHPYTGGSFVKGGVCSKYEDKQHKNDTKADLKLQNTHLQKQIDILETLSASLEMENKRLSVERNELRRKLGLVELLATMEHERRGAQDLGRLGSILVKPADSSSCEEALTGDSNNENKRE